MDARPPSDDPKSWEASPSRKVRGPAVPPADDPPATASPARGDSAALAGELAAELGHLSDSTRHDPFANPILLLALNISGRLRGGQLSRPDLERLIQHLSTEGFLARAARLGTYLGTADPDANRARLEALVESQAKPAADAPPVPFETFRRAVEREIFGIVITAHPTFNLSGAMMETLAQLATGRDSRGAPLSGAERDRLILRAAESMHRPEEMSLSREHALSLAVIANIQAALRTLYAVVLHVARRHYPDRWTDLTPRLLTVASWVGYDLDGRSDIRWSDTLRKRLLVQKHQLRHYLDRVQAIRRDAPGADDLRQVLDLLESRLALALNQVADEVAAFGEEGAASDVTHLERIARRMHESLPLRLVDAGQAVDLLDRAIRLSSAAPEDGAAILLVERLAVLRAELANHGLGLAHTHVRINATQLHNAIRKVVGMETAPDDPRYRQSYLAAITELLDRVEPVRINFGSIVAERTSAKRLFMVVAQMLKYTDAATPIRFLIAESEAAFTILTALYYARLFGVADRVDISPLFETERALEMGSRIIEQLLDNPHYRDYVRRRGRLCIQTGYSDAGRYLGQTPAAASIERLRLRVLKLFTRHELDGIELVIFDTHGESIGRGGHPRSFQDRLSYVSPPATLEFAARNGIAFKQETSFQGGDGFIHFITEPAALAAVTRITEYMLGAPKAPLEEDPFYAEADYVREFFTTVKTFQTGLVQDPNYGALLAAFGTNLLYSSGSRAIKRQHDAADDEPEQTMAAQFRAIPHNAILLQLGLPANALSGTGAAIDRDPQRFLELYGASPRFRQLMGIVEHGLALACPEALRAYVDSLDPGHWLTLARHVEDRATAEECRRIAAVLEESPTHARQIRVYRRLIRDHDLLVENLGQAGISAPHQEIQDRTALALIHAVRLALIHEVFRLAVHVPPFSSQHNITHRRLVSRLLHLDVPWALEQLGQIFPAMEGLRLDGDFGEAANYVSDDSQNYSQENARIFQPIAELYELIRRSGNALTQRIGFFG